MIDSTLVTLNAGSSTVKLGLFRMVPQGPVELLRGVISFHDDPLRLRIDDANGRHDHALDVRPGADIQAVMAATLDRLAGHADMRKVRVVGHRVVHGGDGFSGPAVLSPAVVAALDRLTPYAPLHQGQSLDLVRAIHALRPDLLQTASFDTAFHQSNADLVRRYAIPRALHDQGIKRYGFHGLSYKYIAARLAGQGETGKAVIAHLGSGASLCAIEGGKSRDTSMGFSTLDGVPMATRCGVLDPGVVLHLLEYGGEDPHSLREMLYGRSGLLGMSGISSDSRDLLADPSPQAAEAVAVFDFRVAGEVARLATTLGGLDTLVFTAGIGENQPPIRAAICARLAWLGVALDDEANAANAARISTPDSRIRVLVIPTDEEQVIAAEAFSVIGDAPGDADGIRPPG